MNCQSAFKCSLDYDAKIISHVQNVLLRCNKYAMFMQFFRGGRLTLGCSMIMKNYPKRFGNRDAGQKAQDHRLHRSPWEEIR